MDEGEATETGNWTRSFYVLHSTYMYIHRTGLDEIGSRPWNNGNEVRKWSPLSFLSSGFCFFLFYSFALFLVSSSGGRHCVFRSGPSHNVFHDRENKTDVVRVGGNVAINLLTKWIFYDSYPMHHPEERWKREKRLFNRARSRRENRFLHQRLWCVLIVHVLINGLFFFLFCLRSRAAWTLCINYC